VLLPRAAVSVPSTGFERTVNGRTAVSSTSWESISPPDDRWISGQADDAEPIGLLKAYFRPRPAVLRPAWAQAPGSDRRGWFYRIGPTDFDPSGVIRNALLTVTQDVYRSC
jgi:hypothetical protein